MQPDTPPEDDDKIVEQSVFAERRLGDAPDSLLARASAAERAVVSLETRLREIERELGATARQRDQLASELQQREVTLRETAPEPVAESQPSGARSQLQAEIRTLSERLVRADDRVAELQTQLARARGDVADAQRELAEQRGRMEQGQRGDSDREARLRRLEGRLAAAEAALAAPRPEAPPPGAAPTAIRDGFEQLDSALSRLAERLASERRARLLAEQRLEAERERHRAELASLRSQLGLRAARADDIQQQISALRGELARAVETAQSGRGEAAAEQALAELERARAEAASARSAIGMAREAQRLAEARTEEERRARERVERELEQERAEFAGAVDRAQRRIADELARQRSTLDSHAAAVERTAARLERQAELSRSPALAVPSPGQQAQIERDLAQAAARLRRLAERAAPGPVPQEEEPGELPDAEAAQRALRERAGELAGEIERLREDPAVPPSPEGAGGAPADGEPDPVISQRDQPLPRLVVEAPGREWLARALRELASRDARAAAAVAVELLPAIAPAFPRDAIIDFAIDEVGATRLTITGSRGTVTPWRIGMGSRADLAVAGPVVEMIPLVAGGASRRKPRAIEHSGRRRALRALLKARRRPVTPEDLRSAGAVPTPESLLRLAAAAVPAEWVADQELVVAFEIGEQERPWLVRSAPEGIAVQQGETTAAAAVVTLADAAVLELITGLAGDSSADVSYRGDLGAIERLLGWIHRAQRER